MRWHTASSALLCSLVALVQHNVEAAAVRIAPRQVPVSQDGIQPPNGPGGPAAGTTVFVSQTSRLDRFTAPRSSSSSTTSTPFAGFSSAVSSSSSASASATTSSTSSSSSSGSSDGSQDTPKPVLAPGQNLNNPNAYILYNADEVHYPFTVHLPDRTTRSLPPLDGPPPLVLSLSGSGGRGNSSQAKYLTGFDGTSRFVRQYYEGNRSEGHLIAAEEMLVVTPICPNETEQSEAAWDINVFPNILAQVVATYEVDLTRVYLTTYSMGARAAWPFLMAHPDIFAGVIISSGATYADSDLLQSLLGNSIRNYYGSDDEYGLSNASTNTQNRYDVAVSQALRKSPNNASLYNARTLETIGPIPNADHLNMNEVPWQEQVETDGYPGALSWLMTQVREEGANIPAYNSSICTTCIPTTGGPVRDDDD